MDDISGFYGNRWGVSLFQRVGKNMISLPPGFLKPSLGAVMAEYQGDNKFLWVDGVQNGSFGEITQVVEEDGRYSLRRGESVLQPFDFEY